MSKKREPRVLMIADRARAMRRKQRQSVGASTTNAEIAIKRKINDGRFDATKGAGTAGLLIDQLLEEIGGEG